MLKQNVRAGTKSSRRSSRELLQIHRKTRLTKSDELEVAEQFYIALDTPVSLTCCLLLRYGELAQLVEKDVNPLNYNSGPAFRDDFAAVSFLRKNAQLKTGHNKKESALKAFEVAEGICEGVNVRLRDPSSFHSLNVEDYRALKSARRKIDAILKDFDIDKVLSLCSWGPGSTLLIKGSEVSASHKFDFESEMTRDACDLFLPVMKKAYPTWEKLNHITYKPGNKIITVPKNAKTDRTIAIEPGINTWIQLGIGKLIRERLRKAGFNLQSDMKNQRSARQGSIDDYLATIDFKAASDTISYEVVKFLLPPRWFSVLDSARSHYYTLNGVVHKSEKFSTMGNGFTFELESLIFATLALACCESYEERQAVSIFGDDLIIPTVRVPQLARLCSFLGFTINVEKSFVSGPFRESCGSYFFDGLDVKPYYHKKALLYIKDLYRVSNSIRELAHRFNQYNGCDVRFKATWNTLVSKVPLAVRLFGPQSSGDATIHESFLACHDVQRRKDGWEGFNFPGFPTVAVDVERESHGLLLSRLSVPSRDQAYQNLVALRAKTRILFKRSMHAVQWHDFGPWL